MIGGAYSLYVAEITVYSMHSCTLSQCSDLRIMVRIGGPASKVRQQHEQQHSGCVEGDVTAFEEDRSSNCSSQICSEQRMCQCK